MKLNIAPAQVVSLCGCILLTCRVTSPASALGTPPGLAPGAGLATGGIVIDVSLRKMSKNSRPHQRNRVQKYIKKT